MFENVARVLTDFSKLIAEKYKGELSRQDINASNNLSNSVTATFKKDGIEYCACLDLLPYWEQIEYGREPTKNNGNGELRRNILQWIKVKPVLKRPYNGKLPTDEQLAYLISRKIHTEGYRGKQPLKNVLETEINSVLRKLEEAMSEDIAKQVDKIFILR